MEVIKIGNNSHEYTCYHCKSVMNYAKEDMEKRVTGMCGDYDTEYGFHCPICGAWHEVPYKTFTSKEWNYIYAHASKKEFDK